MKNLLPVLRAFIAVALVMAATHLASANTALWIGNPGVTASTNWSDLANWNNIGGGGSGPTLNDVVFGPTGAAGALGTITSVVDANQHPFSMTFTNATGQYHTVFIPAGLGLTNDNGLAVGTGVVAGQNTFVSIFGAGEFDQNGAVTLNGVGGSSDSRMLLDMSGLASFKNNAPSSTMNLGTAAQTLATVNLAATSFINVATLNLETSGSSNGRKGQLNLGATTNTIWANTINISTGKGDASAIQNTNTAATAVTIGGTGGGAARTAILLGNDVSGSAKGIGQLLLTNCLANVLASTITLGKTSGSGGGTPQTGVVAFDHGTFDVTSILMGNSTRAAALASVGIVSVGGDPANTATLIVGAAGGGSFILGDSTVTTSGSSGAGTNNIYVNGTVRVYCNITKSSTASAVNSGAINILGGTLNVAGLTNTIGSATLPIDALTLSNSTLTLPALSSGACAVVGTLTISGTSDTININTVPANSVIGSQYPLISYTPPLSGTYDFVLGGALPGGFTGHLVNNSASVDLVIDSIPSKVDTWRGNVSGNWDTSTLNWDTSGNASAYAQGDLVTFDDSLTGTANVTLALNVAPGGIAFNNSTHNYVLSGAFKITGPTLALTKQGSGSVTLTESGGDDFASGITVGGGTLILDNANSAIAGGLTINGGTVQIGNNDANGGLPTGAVAINDSGVLIFSRTDSVTNSTAMSGSGGLTQNGSGTLTLSGANTYTGNTTVSAGTLALSGSGSITASSAVSVNNATFDVSALASAASLTSLSLADATVSVSLTGSPAARIGCSSLTFGGTANHLNVVSLPPIGSYPVTFTIIQSAGPASGTFNFAATPSLPAGYTGSVSQSGDTMAVLLTLSSGPVGVPAAVVWIGADSPNVNWSDRLNWQLPAVPGSGDNVVFTPTAAALSSALSTPGAGAGGLNSSLINNIVNANTTISSLTFTNVDGSYHNTMINDGLTLTVTNTLTVGSGSVDFGNTATAFVNIAGPNASFQVNNTNATVYVGLGSGSSGGSHSANLDLSALGTFNATISRLLVGVGSSSCGIPLARENGTVYLAQTNTIIASLTVSGTETSDTSASAIAFGIGDNDGNAHGTCYLYLGQTNAIFADAIGTSRQKENAQMLFNPNVTAAGHPTAFFRGRDGSSIHTWSLADGVVNGGSGVSPTGVADFTGGTVDALVTTMYVGRSPNHSNTGSGTCTGTLTFDDGLFNVGTLHVGFQTYPNAISAVGTINVNSNVTAGANGTLQVRGNLNMAIQTNGTGTGTATLNLNNGTAQIFDVIPGLNSTIAINGGKLMLTNSIGSATAPLGTLSLNPPGSAPDNSATLLCLPVGTNGPGITVTTLNLDGQATTANIINVESVGPLGSVPVDLPLIKYTTMNVIGGNFNVSLGTLPAGYVGSLVNDTGNSQIVLHLTSAISPLPAITSTTVLSSSTSTNVVCSGSNGFANRPYSVLTSTDLTTPLDSWTSATTGVFAPDGSFSFTVPLNAATPAQFFRVQVQ